jgi:uncharacterized membrane protein YozB (DUF420 family)
MNYAILPPVNACLNGLSAVFLMTGYWFIKHGRKDIHRICMSTAFITSIIFLACYLTYHFHAHIVPFRGQGWIRPVYFFILTTHTILAAIVPVLAIITITRALKGNFEKHKKIARITFPIWLYVSVTGVVVYVMLLPYYPPS